MHAVPVSSVQKPQKKGSGVNLLVRTKIKEAMTELLLCVLPTFSPSTSIKDEGQHSVWVCTHPGLDTWPLWPELQAARVPSEHHLGAMNRYRRMLAAVSWALARVAHATQCSRLASLHRQHIQVTMETGMSTATSALTFIGCILQTNRNFLFFLFIFLSLFSHLFLKKIITISLFICFFYL